MALVVLVWIVVALVFAPITARKAARLGGSYWSWFFVALCLPVISLAVIGWYEGGRGDAE